MSFLKPQERPESTVTLDSYSSMDQSPLSAFTPTRTKLNALLAMYKPLFGKCRPRLKGASELHEVLVKWVRGKYVGMVAPQLQLYYRVLTVPANLAKAIDEMPELYVRVLKECIVKGTLTLSRLNEVFRTEGGKMYRIIGQDGYLAKTMTTVDNMRAMLLPTEEGYVVEPNLAELLIPVLGISEMSGKSTTTDVLPDADYRIFNAQKEVLGKAARAFALMEQMSVPYAPSSASPIMARTLKSLVKAMPMEHFPFDESSGSSLRETFFWNCMANYPLRHVDNVPDSYVGMCTRYMTMQQYAHMILPGGGTFYKSMFEDLLPRDYVVEVLRALAKYALPEGSDTDNRPDPWINVFDLVNEIIVHFPKRHPAAIEHYANYYTYGVGGRITRSNVRESFTQPLVRGFLAIFAALGVVEAAFVDTAWRDAAIYGYEDLHYVRLTTLGRYIAGRDKSLRVKFDTTVPEDPATTCELDNRRLIIFTEDEGIGDVIKRNYGTKIMLNRYEVTDTSFLRKVDSVNKLKAKIKEFKKLVGCISFPAVWAEFFDNLVVRFDSFTPIPLSDYFMFKVSGANSDRIFELLTTYTQLRRLVKLVEGGYIMIKKDDYLTVRDIFESLGYILPAGIQSYVYRW